jgi:hypothetical protein
MKTTIPRRRRCGARVKYHRKAIQQYELGQIDKAEVLRVLRRSDRCRNWALPGSRRCRLHGGMSTGARTEQGKRRQAEGYRWGLEWVRAEGRKPGPAKGTGGRPKGLCNPSPAPKAKRRLDQAAIRLARARLLLRHALSSGPGQRRQRWEGRQEIEREVRRLVDRHQAEWRLMRMPPLSGEKLDRVVKAFRQRATVSAPTAASWPHIGDLQDRVRAAEEALERAKADVARTAASTPARRSTTVAAAEAAAA